MFASASTSLRIHSWPADQIYEKAEFIPISNSKISHMSWCNDNTYLAIHQENEKPQILSTRNLDNIRTVHTITTPNVSSIVFKNKTKRNLAMGTQNGEVLIYDTKCREITKCYGKLVSPIEHTAFSFDDLHLGVLCEDTAVIFDTESDGEINTEFKHDDKCTSIKFHPTEINRVVVGGEKGYVSLWDTRVSVKAFSAQLHSDNVTGLNLSRCGNYLISSGKDHKFCLTDLNSGKCKFRLNLNLPISSMDLRYDDKLIAVGLIDGSIHLYDLNFTLQPLSIIKAHDFSTNKVLFANAVQNGNDNESMITTVVLNNNISANQIKANELEVENMDNLKQLKNEIVKMMKQQSDELESRLNDHCRKLQQFVNNEFKMINNLLKDKWELFGSGDGDDFFKKIAGEGSEFSSK